MIEVRIYSLEWPRHLERGQSKVMKPGFFVEINPSQITISKLVEYPTDFSIVSKVKRTGILFKRLKEYDSLELTNYSKFVRIYMSDGNSFYVTEDAYRKVKELVNN